MNLSHCFSKSIAFAAFGCCMISLSACSKSPIEEPLSPPNSLDALASNPNFAPVSQKDGKLVFESVDHLEYTVSTVIKMTEEERNAWYSALNFKSIQTIYGEVNDQINAMQSYQEYLDIQAKYDKSFMFNKKDKEDLPPYFRLEKILYAYVLNGDGEAVVGGETVNYNAVTSVEQTKQYQLATSPMTKAYFTNNLFVNDGKRKLWIDVQIINEDKVYIRFGCQVNSFWGWNTFRQSYFLNMYNDRSVGFTEPFTEEIGKWIQTPVLSDGDVKYIGTAIRHPYYPENAVWTMLVYASDMGIDSANDFRFDIVRYKPLNIN